MKVRVRGSAASRLRRSIEVIQWATLAAGVVLVGWPVFVWVDSAHAQWSGERELATPNKQRREQVVVRKPAASSRGAQPARGSVLGKFEVPRLKLSWVLLEGTDDRTLDRSIGHVEGSALIGSAGNIAIAGHRNTHFRKLEWIRRGDEIVMSGSEGEYRYRVEWIRLAEPEDIQVLDPAHGPAVTLVTCFPFEYVGSAPLRFIVRALPDEETKARLQTRHQAGDAAGNEQ
jgi:sortase A